MFRYSLEISGSCVQNINFEVNQDTGMFFCDIKKEGESSYTLIFLTVFKCDRNSEVERCYKYCYQFYLKLIALLTVLHVVQAVLPKDFKHAPKFYNVSIILLFI
eukprot:sb/3478035/